MRKLLSAFLLIATLATFISCQPTTEENKEKPVVEPTEITLDKTVLKMAVGETVTLTATVIPSDANNKEIKWISSDETVATVKDGVITGLAYGKSEITALTGNNKKATCTVEINEIKWLENTTATTLGNYVVISPDTGAMDRAIYYSSVLGVDVGLFYKRRDHSTIVNGKNPIVQHEYMGRNVEDKDVLIVDDMIASGESVLDIATELKARKARNVYVATTFAFFTEGLEKFNKFCEDGIITRVYSTNLTYIPQELRDCSWFRAVDMSLLVSKIINKLNYNKSIASYMDATRVIRDLLEE